MKRKLKPTFDNDNYYLEGILLTFNKPNVNGNIITRKEFESHLETLQEKISKQIFLGELYDDEQRDFPYDIRLSNVSHVVESIELKPGKLVGKIRILNTPMGAEVKKLIDKKEPLYASYRMLGDVNEDNTITIKKIFSFDLARKEYFENDEE